MSAKYILARPSGCDCCSDTYLYHMGVFDCIENAQFALDTVSRTYPDYIARAQTWKEREKWALDYGTHIAPIWKGEAFWIDRPRALFAHFAHVALGDATKIAFTEDEGKGEADRQTVMKPGRYLARYFGDVLTPKQIAFYAEFWAKGERPTSTLAGDIAFATTPDEIVQVYEEGPASCMSGVDCVRVYGAGDLAIAYIKRPDGWTESDGPGRRTVPARAICWPERKVFGRIYPTPDRWSADGFHCEADAVSAQDRLEQGLRSLGFQQATSHPDGMNGARLLREESDEGGWVMPYLDKGYGVNMRGDYFVLAKRGEYVCDSTGGVINGPDEDEDDEYEYEYSCNHCGDGMNDAESVYHEWSSAYGPRRGVFYCATCASDHTFYCDATERYYSDDVDNVEVEGDTWVSSYAEANAYYCDGQGDWFRNDTPRVELTNGDIYEAAYFYTQGMLCAYDGGYYLYGEMSAIFPGFPASLDDNETIPAEIREAFAPPIASAISDASPEQQTIAA
jgi:hypothetical protein